MTTDTQPKLWTAPRVAAAAGLLALQFAAAWWIGTQHLLAFDGTTPFPPIAITAVVPVLLFFLAYGAFPGFRDFMLAQDMQALTAIQLWRVVGFTMLGVYAFDGLPALFALPAGLGDVAVSLRLRRHLRWCDSSGSALPISRSPSARRPWRRVCSRR